MEKDLKVLIEEVKALEGFKKEVKVTEFITEEVRVIRCKRYLLEEDMLDRNEEGLYVEVSQKRIQGSKDLLSYKLFNLSNAEYITNRYREQKGQAFYIAKRDTEAAERLLEYVKGLN
jgi:hypothetical protein